MPDCGVHYLWFAFVCFLIRSPPPPLPHLLCRPPSQADPQGSNSQTTPATTSTSSIRQLLGAADAQTAHPATFSTAPTHQLLGSANAETTPARAPAAAATESSNPTQHAKGRTGDCPGPRKGATTRRNVTQGGGGASLFFTIFPLCSAQLPSLARVRHSNSVPYFSLRFSKFCAHQFSCAVIAPRPPCPPASFGNRAPIGVRAALGVG